MVTKVRASMAHFEEAAARGHADAFAALGRLHESGHRSGAVRRDAAVAASWYASRFFSLVVVVVQ